MTCCVVERVAPPADVNGNFVVGPTHPAAPETVVQDTVPQGTVSRWLYDATKLL